MNKTEGLLESNVMRKGRIEHHIVAFDSISIVSVDVKTDVTGVGWKGQL